MNKPIQKDRAFQPQYERKQKSLALKHDTNKILQLTQYWVPPVPDWQPHKKAPNSSLRMACIVEDRLYHGLRFEGEVLLLTPHNWNAVLTYGKPDFLLMDSFWSTATGHWYMGQNPDSPDYAQLLEIIGLARRLSIPTIFWITKGHQYNEHYKPFASQFDYVFCADPRQAELLRAEGIKAELLLPCVQPALYNPFRLYEYCDSFNLSNLFDGWADLDRFTDELNILEKVKQFGLSICESRYQIFRSRMDVLPQYKDCIMGCVTLPSRILALKYAKAYITCEKTISSLTTQQWLTLEAAACRLPVVHHGKLAAADPRKNVVIECPKQMDLLVEFVRFQQDDLYRRRVGHLGWRQVNRQYTFSHRLQTICRTIGMAHDWEEFPKASLITPTYRRNILPSCLQKYDQQTYPNKELIIVFNGSELLSIGDLGLNKSRDDVRLSTTPSEMFAGACLNYGNLLSKGKYFFRIDDDDHYGQNYVLDMVTLARSIDADLFGKPPASFIFENEKTVYSRSNIFPLTILNKTLINEGKVRLGGNSISGSKYFFKKICYSDKAYGAADSFLLYNSHFTDDMTCAIMDDMNLVAVRRKDQKTHTWKQDKAKLKQECSFASNFIDNFI